MFAGIEFCRHKICLQAMYVNMFLRNNVQLCDTLASLDIMGDQLRVPLIPLGTSQYYRIEGPLDPSDHHNTIFFSGIKGSHEPLLSY